MSVLHLVDRCDKLLVLIGILLHIMVHPSDITQFDVLVAEGMKLYTP